jgi:dTDP-4-dehydrorhamnose 3,5-epimerase
MKIITTDLPDILLIQPTVFEDERGFFMETYQQRNYEQAGILKDFVQDNHSSSIRSTLRGLHYQVTHPQGKLVRVVIGEVFDVAVDLRKGSSLFGKWVGAVLSQANKLQMWIPPGFAHGFFVLSERADVLYKTTDYFDATGERTIRWDDPDLAIDWPIPPGVTPILSEKDKTSPSFKQAEVFA